MLESAWWFVGSAAFVWTLVTLGIAMYAEAGSGMGDSMATLAGAIGTVAWGVWVFGALNVRVAGDAVVYSFTLPGVALLGIAFALIPFYIFLTGPLELVRRAQAPQADEI